jgi:hypothetical protein
VALNWKWLSLFKDVLGVGRRYNSITISHMICFFSVTHKIYADYLRSLVWCCVLNNVPTHYFTYGSTMWQGELIGVLMLKVSKVGMSS